MGLFCPSVAAFGRRDRAAICHQAYELQILACRNFNATERGLIKLTLQAVTLKDSSDLHRILIS
jgi:hypothetical protein